MLSSNVRQMNTAPQISAAEQQAHNTPAAVNKDTKPQIDAKERAKAGTDAVHRDMNESSEKENENNLSPQQEFTCEEIWNAVFEDGEAAKGSFYMIGSSGRLTEIGENTFTVEMSSEPKKELAEKNRALLEDLMERHTGKRRTMMLKTAGKETSAETERKLEEIAKEAGALLGIDVEIQ